MSKSLMLILKLIRLFALCYNLNKNKTAVFVALFPSDPSIFHSQYSPVIIISPQNESKLLHLYETQ